MTVQKAAIRYAGVPPLAVALVLFAGHGRGSTPDTDQRTQSSGSSV